MSLPPGLRLGPYEVLSPLGAGFMGEVCRARDTRFGREMGVESDTSVNRPKPLESRSVNHPPVLSPPGTLF